MIQFNSLFYRRGNRPREVKRPGQVHLDFGTGNFLSLGSCPLHPVPQKLENPLEFSPTPILLLKRRFCKESFVIWTKKKKKKLGLLNRGHGTPEAEIAKLCHPLTPQLLWLPCTWNLPLTKQKTATGQYQQPPTTSTIITVFISTSRRRAALFLAMFSPPWMFLNPKSKETTVCGCVRVIEGEIRKLCLKISSWSFMLLWPRMSAKHLNLFPNLEMPIISNKAMLLFTGSSGLQSGKMCSGYTTMTPRCIAGARWYTPCERCLC